MPPARKTRASGGCRQNPAPAILLRLRRRDLHKADRCGPLRQVPQAEQVIRVHDPIAAGRRAALRAVAVQGLVVALLAARSEEHTYELQSLMRISYAVFCLKKKKQKTNTKHKNTRQHTTHKKKNTQT